MLILFDYLDSVLIIKVHLKIHFLDSHPFDIIPSLQSLNLHLLDESYLLALKVPNSYIYQVLSVCSESFLN